MDNVREITNNYILGFNRLLEIYPEYKDSVINLWCRGSSGSILATSFALGIDNKSIICHVKKEGESSHSSGPKFSVDGINIIIDDFISTGSTISSIIKEMDELGMLKNSVNILII